jgi:hypothetical protein
MNDTERDVLEGAGLSPDEWSLTEYRQWDVATKDHGVMPCAYFKARRLVSPKLAADVVARIRAIGQETKSEERLQRGDILLELALSDMHIGAWTNGPPKKHAKRCVKTAKRLALRADAQANIGRVLLVLAGDTFHADTLKGETTKGTALEDVGAPYEDIFREGVAAICALVSWLAKRWPVDVEVVPGNHDRLASFHLGELLEAAYKGNRRVNINGGLEPFRRVRWGTVLLGLAHGDTPRSIGDLRDLMSSQWPQDWGETTFREWHTGDKHRQQQFEKGGVRIRVLPPLVGRSAYATHKGYTDSHQGAEGYLWHRRDGYMGHLFEVSG